MMNAEQNCGRQKTEKERTYRDMETMMISLVFYITALLIFRDSFNIEADASAVFLWGFMAGVVFVLPKIGNPNVIYKVVAVWGTVLFLWFLFDRTESRWQYAVIFYGSWLVLHVLFFVLQKIVGKLLCGFGTVGLLVVSRLIGIEHSKAVVAMSIFLFLYTISELIAHFYQDNTRFLVIIYALTAVLTVFTPAPKEAYDWKIVYRIMEVIQNTAKNIVNEIQYQFSDITMDGMLSFKVTGYSDAEMNLFRGMISQDVEQLVLQGNYTRSNLYLKGRAYHSYVGSGWETEGECQIDYRIDTLMTLYAIFEETEDIEELNRFMEIKEQEIIFKNIKTKTLFYPSKVLYISETNTNPSGDWLQAKQMNKRGYEYEYCFIDLDYANETLINIMSRCKEMSYKKEDYNRIYTNLENLYHVKIEKIPFEIFCEQAELAKREAKNRKWNNEFVSDRVKKLAKEVALAGRTDYERCKLLEKYLYQYPYNQSTVIPKDVNVLDYFLFDGREGYCAHYATALAAMLQSEGIPARVAEGFLVNYKERTDIYAYSVSSEFAHIWVEAYLDGFGWIRLEPTACYREVVERPWHGKETSKIKGLNPIIEEEDEGQTNEKESEENIFIPKDKNQKETESWFMTIKVLLLMLLCIATVATVVMICHQKMVRRSNQPEIVFERLLIHLKKRYISKEASETVAEYISRICLNIVTDSSEKEKLIKATNLMEGYWYGDKEISLAEIMWLKEEILS